MNSIFRSLSIIFCSLLIAYFPTNTFYNNCSIHNIELNFSTSPVRNIDSIFYSEKILSLQESFGANKVIIPKFKLQSLVALSFFPKLKNTHISFVYKSINTTMQCKPKVNTILRDKENREYVITINNNSNFKGVLLDEVPFNAQIGVIGHELSHVIDYENQNAKGIINRGFDYLSEEKKKEFEYYIDSLTITIGLGWQIYDWADFVLNKSKASEEYKCFKRRIYLTPEMIFNQINKNSNYKKCLKN